MAQTTITSTDVEFLDVDSIKKLKLEHSGLDKVRIHVTETLASSGKSSPSILRGKQLRQRINSRRRQSNIWVDEFCKNGLVNTDRSMNHSICLTSDYLGIECLRIVLKLENPWSKVDSPGSSLIFNGSTNVDFLYRRHKYGIIESFSFIGVPECVKTSNKTLSAKTTFWGRADFYSVNNLNTEQFFIQGFDKFSSITVDFYDASSTSVLLKSYKLDRSSGLNDFERVAFSDGGDQYSNDHNVVRFIAPKGTKYFKIKAVSKDNVHPIKSFSIYWNDRDNLLEKGVPYILERGRGYVPMNANNRGIKVYDKSLNNFILRQVQTGVTTAKATLPIYEECPINLSSLWKRRMVPLGDVQTFPPLTKISSQIFDLNENLLPFLYPYSKKKIGIFLRKKKTGKKKGFRRGLGYTYVGPASMTNEELVNKLPTPLERGKGEVSSKKHNRFRGYDVFNSQGAFVGKRVAFIKGYFSLTRQPKNFRKKGLTPQQKKVNIPYGEKLWFTIRIVSFNMVKRWCIQIE